MGRLILFLALGCAVLLPQVPASAQEGGPSEDEAEFCTKSFGCHKNHSREKINCPGCDRRKIPGNDAFCSVCAIKEGVCGHCGKPRESNRRSRSEQKETRKDLTDPIPLPTIRVLIQPNVNSVDIDCQGPVDITAPGAKKPLRQFKVLGPCTVKLEGGKFSAHDLTVTTETLIAVCRHPEAPIKIGKRQYLGEIHFVVSKEGFHVVSHVDLETYLLGVVGPEIGFSSPEEAMKTQAICARSYAYYGLERASNNSNSVWDVYDDTRSQVYIGLPTRNNDSVKEAIEATRGMFLMWNGKVVRSEFSSSCGGQTLKMHNFPGVECTFCRRKKYGHARGLCQWGAINMAKEDWTYDKILKHYYTGVEIATRY